MRKFGLVGGLDAQPGVKTVRAVTNSDNNASLATIAGFGFTRFGEQGNERDGLEIVFEVPADAIHAEQPHGPGGSGLISGGC